MNTRAKGRRNELRCKEALEAMGYSVQLTAMPTKWALQQDLWGLFDLAAVRGSDIRFVQVKTNQGAPRAWREAATAWQCPSNCTKEVWVYYDRVKEPKILVL